MLLLGNKKLLKKTGLINVRGNAFAVICYQALAGADWQSSHNAPLKKSTGVTQWPKQSCPCCSLHTITTEREYFEHTGCPLKNRRWYLVFLRTVLLKQTYISNISLSQKPEAHSSFPGRPQAWAFAEVCYSCKCREWPVFWGRYGGYRVWRSWRWRYQWIAQKVQHICCYNWKVYTMYLKGVFSVRTTFLFLH